MQVRVRLLVLSLAINTALIVALVLRPSLASPAFREFFSRGSPTTPSVPLEKPPAAAVAEDQLWSALHSSDIPTLLRRLRAAGFPPAMARAVVTAAVDAEFAPRFDALLAPVAAAPYWKPDLLDAHAWNISGLGENYNQLYRERTKRLRDVLADDFFAHAPTDEERRAMGDLPPAKLEAIRRINDDYAAMNSQVSAAMLDITLPGDREKLALLEREKRADLAAALTPAELAEYNLHSSPVLSQLRSTLTLMDASEDEFRTIFRLRNALEDQMRLAGLSGSDPAALEQRAAMPLLLAQNLKDALGDQRYADYARASNNEFQTLTRFALRENLSTDVTVRAFSLRDSVAAESNRIADDAALSIDQKRAALKSLAQNTRVQIQTLLGPTAGTSYVQIANYYWLNAVDQGNAVTVRPDNLIGVKHLSSP
jgi:hypothetical protein